jgi:SPP1 gp7 family putative phage head morphogenesis protein
VALAAVLAAGYAASELTPRISRLLGVARPVAALLARLGTQRPSSGTSRRLQVRITVNRTTRAQATRRQVQAESLQRARYLTAAAERLGKATTAQELAAAAKRERGYLDQHLEAQRRRNVAAAQVDAAAAKHGPVLGWSAVRDDRTTPDCRALHGTNFRADHPPTPGWPGTLHGSGCRCRASAPFLNAKTTDEMWASLGTAAREAEQAPPDVVAA